MLLLLLLRLKLWLLGRLLSRRRPARRLLEPIWLTLTSGLLASRRHGRRVGGREKWVRMVEL